LGRIDLLVNNADVFKDVEFDVCRRIMELDFFAPAAPTKALLAGMRAMKATR